MVKFDDTVDNKKLEESRAKEYTFKLLGKRDYISSRLKTKLEKRGYSPEVILKVIKYLEKVSLLDDRRFALNYARSRLNKKPRGSRVLRYELFKKGIHSQLTGEVISSIYDEISEEELIRKLVKKKTVRRKVTDEIKDGLYRKLSRLGFSYESIEKVLKKNAE